MLKEHPGNENVTVLSIDAAQIYSLLFSEMTFRMLVLLVFVIISSQMFVMCLSHV